MVISIMGSFKCICGNIISDVCEPDEKLGFLYNSWDENLSEDCDSRSVWECNECGTLALEDPLGTNRIKFYIPENKEIGNLFKRTDI